MSNKKDQELLKSLIKQQFDMDDHGIYIYGRREDYTHVRSSISIDEKIKPQNIDNEPFKQD